MGYTVKEGECPFWKWDKDKSVNCEVGKITFPDRLAMSEFVVLYCCGDKFWDCTIYQSLCEYFERKK